MRPIATTFITPSMILLSSIIPFLSLARLAAGTLSDSFTESLTLHPLPDGKLSVLFEFTTHFSARSMPGSIAQSHHTLTPPSLLLPLEQNDVSELTISFVVGQWDQRRSGEAGPLHYEAGGGGGEVRGWLRSGSDREDPSDRWTRVTHALGGLFCAGLGPNEHGESVNTFGEIYPPLRGDASNLTHHLLPHPNLLLCTENLTPFLSLLPSKGRSGLSVLLAQPHTVFSWGFKTEGIEVIMPTEASPGRWRGWWEGVVDLVPEKGAGSRAFSISRLFNQNLPQPFPESTQSVLRLIMPDAAGLRTDRQPSITGSTWIDGKKRQVAEWDLENPDTVKQDIQFWWDGEERFEYPRSFTPPPVTVSRTVTAPHAGDGVFTVRIQNTGNDTRSAVYSEIWPWWVKGWLHQITVSQIGLGEAPHLLEDIFYKPSSPPTVSTTTLHLSLQVPPRSSLVIKIPFTKLMLKYTEHRPDAERGAEIPSGTLTLLDLEGEGDAVEGVDSEGQYSPRRSGRSRIYTNRLLLDVPTPDFSMPYNVIIMSSTVMAIFFGLMQGSLTRRWGFVEVPLEGVLDDIKTK